MTFLLQRDLRKFEKLDGEKHPFLILNVDIHSHSQLLKERGPFELAQLYRLASLFFQMAVETNHGMMAPWQGDGGFAVFSDAEGCGPNNAWMAAEDFLYHYQPEILRALLRHVEQKDVDEWRKKYPQFYALIDRAEFVFDFSSPGNWCGYGLSQSLKHFKDQVQANALSITPAAFKEFKPTHWSTKGIEPPKEQEGIYCTRTFGADYIISNPSYRERIFKHQRDNIAARNKLTESVIADPSLLKDSKKFIVLALHLVANSFAGRDDIGKNSFRASVWRREGDKLCFVWGYPNKDAFTTPCLKGSLCKFAIGEGLAGKVWETGQPILKQTIGKKDNDFVWKHQSHKDVSAAAYPILPKERLQNGHAYKPDDLLGILCLGVGSESTFRFKEEDKDLIESYITPFTLNMALAMKLMDT